MSQRKTNWRPPKNKGVHCPPQLSTSINTPQHTLAIAATRALHLASDSHSPVLAELLHRIVDDVDDILPAHPEIDVQSYMRCLDSEPARPKTENPSVRLAGHLVSPLGSAVSFDVADDLETIRDQGGAAVGSVLKGGHGSRCRRRSADVCIWTCRSGRDPDRDMGDSECSFEK